MSNSDSFMEKTNFIATCTKVEDIFSRPDLIDPVKDYSQIVRFCFEPKVIQDFILEMLKNGNEDLVTENLNLLSISDNWNLTKKSENFKEIFFENFDRVLDNNSNINDELIQVIGFSERGNEVLFNNWEKLIEKTNNNIISRIQLLEVLKENKNGKELIDKESEKLFYGDFQYSFYIPKILEKNIMTKQQIAELLIKNPTKILEETLEKNDDYMLVLDHINEILEDSSELENDDIEDVKKGIEDSISNNFSKILRNFRERKGYKIKPLKKLKKWNTDEKKIDKKLKEEFVWIADDYNKEETIDFLHIYSDIDVKMKEPDIDTVIKDTFPEITDEYLQYSISYITKELMDSQNLNINQMEIFGQGEYSKCLKIGDYIFKIGKTRGTVQIPYHEKIVQPLIRQPLLGEDDENVFLEIQCVEDAEWYKGLSNKEIEEELYKIYASLRDKGIRWSDARKENVARLKKANIDIFDIAGQVLKPDDDRLGIKNKDGDDKKALQEGELVIIDTDYIYDIDEPFVTTVYSYDPYFEARYIEEHLKNNQEEKSEEDDNSKGQITLEDINYAVETNKTKQKAEDEYEL